MRLSSHRFSVMTFAFLTMLGVICAMSYRLMFSFGNPEREAYQALMEKADPSRVSNSSPYTAKQQHTSVRKDIRAIKNGKDLHFRLFSENTELILDHHNAQTDVIEKMRDVIGYMQEELYYLLPDNKEVVGRQSDGKLVKRNGEVLSEEEVKTLRPVQIIQYLAAENAYYYYQTEKLIAKQVKISRFLAAGHTLEDKPDKLHVLLEGTADSIDFALAKSNPKFVAVKLTAILHNPDENHIVVNSEHAQYDGKQIVLNGNVTVQHDVGNISAQEVIISSKYSQHKSPFNNIHMSSGVRLATGAGELSCSRAEIDYELYRGNFYSDTREPVIYRELTAPSKVLKVESDHMLVEMNPETKEKSSRNCLKSVVAHGHVNVNFNDFIATADHGTYTRAIMEQTSSSLIVLSSSEEGQGICEVSNRNGDRIIASEIWMDTDKRSVKCHNPDGLLLYAAQAKPNQVHFSCKIMDWDEEKQRLTLSEQVKIEQEGLGVVITDEQIAFVRQYIDGVPQLCLAESTGNTLFVYTDLEKNEKHTLQCQGKAVIDHPHKEIHIVSPRDTKGNIAKHKQIFFQDSLGDIYADTMSVHYAVNEHKFSVSSMYLEGHVHMHNRGSIEPGKTKSFLEYALADAVEYSPNTKEVLLSAFNKRRVLFFDKVNNLQISAPKLKIKRDAVTQQDSVQGIGDVRFNFVKTEVEEMKKYMAFD